MMTRSDPPAREALHPGEGLVEQIVRLADGRRIRTVTAGRAGGPMVVFEAGMTAPAAEWLAVQRGVASRARTLAYDRSGYGGSDDDPQPRTLERMADDLAGMLSALGETRPVVLVAHSWGGPIVRTFAHRHPELVAGVVMVDASLAEITANRRQMVLGKASFRLCALLVRLGAASTVVRMALPHGRSPDLSDDDMRIITRDYASVRAMRTGVREVDQVVAERAMLERLEQAGLPDVPVIALQGGREEKGRSARRLRSDFNSAARAVIARQPHGRIVIVENAGHLIPQEQPAAVIEAILDVVEPT